MNIFTNIFFSVLTFCNLLFVVLFEIKKFLFHYINRMNVALLCKNTSWEPVMRFKAACMLLSHRIDLSISVNISPTKLARVCLVSSPDNLRFSTLSSLWKIPNINVLASQSSGLWASLYSSLSMPEMCVWTRSGVSEIQVWLFFRLPQDDDDDVLYYCTRSFHEWERLSAFPFVGSTPSFMRTYWGNFLWCIPKFIYSLKVALRTLDVNQFSPWLVNLLQLYLL